VNLHFDSALLTIEIHCKAEAQFEAKAGERAFSRPGYTASFLQDAITHGRKLSNFEHLLNCFAVLVPVHAPVGFFPAFARLSCREPLVG
jgi:hypothetical protein